MATQLDVLIFGGGAAGLWLLDALGRRGARALLLESDRLGSGQTIAAQGIIHGGLKYTLQGLLTPSAVQIREMPALWRECLAGRRQPDLSRTRIRSDRCHLWRTDSLTSRLGLFGARVGLRVAPQLLADNDRPAVLAGCPGPVALLEEQVIAPDSLLENLFSRNASRILEVDPLGIAIENDSSGRVRAVRLSDSLTGSRLDLAPAHVVLAAGKGNAELRRQMGLGEQVMQCRPLHMVLLRGDLPELNGHCVDGATTRVTVTSDRDRAGRTVWQVGGQIAEIGVGLDERSLILHTKAEIEATIPRLDLNHVEWATYRVDRAEGATPQGNRPETVQLLRERNVLTAWPTKLALVPALAEQILAEIEPFGSDSTRDSIELENWPRPRVATLPWDAVRTWYSSRSLEGFVRKAA